MSPFASIVLTAGLLVTAPAVAATSKVPKADSHLMDEMLACRDLADSVARLRCFDERSARLASAKAQGDVVVVERAEVQRARRSLFGLTLPRLPFLDGLDKNKPDTAPEQLETAIVNASDAPNGYIQVVLEEGGVWRTTEPWSGRLPRAGAPVTIKRSTMGSFILRIDNGRSLRAVRIR